MALGGGEFLFYNKKLSGTYINVASKERAMTDVAVRGYAAMALELDWGETDKIVRVNAEDFQKNSMKIFGYDFGHPKMKGLRDLFIHLKTLYFYRLNGAGAKAKNKYAEALYPGTRGNDISISIQNDIENSGKFVVSTFIKNADGSVKEVDRQANIKAKTDLKDNDYVKFLSTFEAAEANSQSLTGGTNGDTVNTSNYQTFIDLIEPYYFNILGYAGADDTIKNLLIAFTKRARNQTGAKFQLIIHGKEKVNFEGVISVKNNVTDSGYDAGSLVYWLTGAEASCPINESCLNKLYNGEFTVNTNYKQYELEQFLIDGMLTFHNVTDSVSGNVLGDVRVGEDINTFTEFKKSKNKDFSYNQVIRIIDNLSIDLSRLFNKVHLGTTMNDKDGRVSLWKDGVALLEEYARVRAIQNFNEKDLPIPEAGEDKDVVIWTYQVQPTTCMSKLYCTVLIV